jgi:hypothetical protein
MIRTDESIRWCEARGLNRRLYAWRLLCRNVSYRPWGCELP